jgi:hypothetical protein
VTASSVTISYEEGRIVVAVTMLDGGSLRLHPTPDEADRLAVQLIAAAAHARRHTTQETAP